MVVLDRSRSRYDLEGLRQFKRRTRLCGEPTVAEPECQRKRRGGCDAKLVAVPYVLDRERILADGKQKAREREVIEVIATLRDLRASEIQARQRDHILARGNRSEREMNVGGNRGERTEPKELLPKETGGGAGQNKIVL